MHQVADFLDNHDMWEEPYRDLLDVAPDTTIEQAYLLQHELMGRRVATGDRVIGYKAAGTTRATQNLLGSQPFPVTGTLLRSSLLEEGQTFETRVGKTFIEAEIGIITGRNLVGPGISYLDVLSAIDCFVGSVEISPWSPAAVEKRRSAQHIIATQKTTGGIIVGRTRMLPSDFDCRFEGAAVEVNGEFVGSGTGAEAMGDPLVVVAAIANNLGRQGKFLEAGSLVMTGSVAAPLPGDRALTDARITFTRLGSIGVRFRPHAS